MRDLMEQVSFLKEAIVRKDEELRLTKVNGSSQKVGMSTTRGRPSMTQASNRYKIQPTQPTKVLISDSVPVKRRMETNNIKKPKSIKDLQQQQEIVLGALSEFARYLPVSFRTDLQD